jgi:hypothetical protein
MSDIDCDINQKKCVKLKRDDVVEIAKSCGIKNVSKSKFPNVPSLCKAIVEKRGGEWEEAKLDCNITDGKCNKTSRSDLEKLAVNCGISKDKAKGYQNKLVLCEAIRKTTKKSKKIEEEDDEDEKEEEEEEEEEEDEE